MPAIRIGIRNARTQIQIQIVWYVCIILVVNTPTQGKLRRRRRHRQRKRRRRSRRQSRTAPQNGSNARPYPCVVAALWQVNRSRICNASLALYFSLSLTLSLSLLICFISGTLFVWHNMTSNYCDPASVPVPFRSTSPLPLARSPCHSLSFSLCCFPFPFAIAIAARPVAHDRLSDHRKKKHFKSSFVVVVL